MNTMHCPESEPMLGTTSSDPGNSEDTCETLDIPIAHRKGVRTCTQHPISKFVSYDSLSPCFRAFTTKLCSVNIPRSIEEALAVPEWKNTVLEEMQALEKNNTWSVVELPQGKSVVGCKWVFTVKFKPDGSIERYKARLVAKGFTQTYGIDYTETFAPVAKFNTIRVLLSLAANLDWPLVQFDVKNAFLNGELEEEVYMSLPPGFEEVARSKNGISISERKYTLDLLQETGMLGCKPIETPIEQGGKAKAIGGEMADRERYQRLVGKLIYLSHTRPDIAFAISVVSQQMHSLRQGHFEAIYRILRYLKKTPGRGLFFGKEENRRVEIFTDADWAGSVEDRNQDPDIAHALVTWRSKKQFVVARSSAEAEYRAMAHGTCKAIWLKRLLEELKISCEFTMQLYCDNNATISIAHNLAALYQTDFRPVPLEEYIKVGNTIYNKQMDVVRTICKAADLGGKDPDHVVELCNEVVQEGHSVLIFCSTRKGCESTARHVSRFLKSYSVGFQNADTEFVDITSAIDALRRSPAGLDPILEETLPFGVAYHHAGLVVEEREIVETCYRKGLVRVLTATSTLAAGVNLPARRVIFRQPRIGRDFLDGTRYKQMAGRAGRTGIDTKGESVLICKPEEIKRILGLLNEDCPPLHSCLSEDMNGMIHAILEVVAGGIVQTANDIHRYVRCTLLNSTKPFQDVVKSAQESLRWLCHRKFLEWNEDTKLYSTTPLGRASFGSSLSPEESLVKILVFCVHYPIVLDDLSRAREGFVLASDLHLVYLVTPINVDVEPNWELYYQRFMELSPLDQSVGYRVGVMEPFLMRMAHGAPMRTSKSKEKITGLHGKFQNPLGITNNTLLSDEQALRVCKRFYVALILSRLVQEALVAEVCEAFNVARGKVQALQENAGRFASMVSVFCERLGWHDLEGLVAKFQNRVSFGVRSEIVELTTIPYVKGSRARALYKAGLRTPLSIAEASIPEIVKALFETSSWAGQGSAQRRIQVGAAKKIKNAARKIVLEKAEEARIAAFSAFKSLGLDVPQFSGPPLPAAAGNPWGQGASTSPGNGTGNSFVGELLVKTSEEGTVLTDKAVSVSEEKLTRALDTNTVAPEVHLDGIMPHELGASDPMVLVEGSDTLQNEIGAPVCRSKDANLTQLIQLQKQDDKTMTDNVAVNPRTGEQRRNVNLSSGSKVAASKKGPILATNTPGGFDSFLDLWDNATEFYFDVHYNKRSEMTSGSHFELHGIAICWENSAVYYVSLPKDLLWSNNKINDCLHSNSSGKQNNLLPSNNWLEMVRRRWDRISGIMGKRDVRKYTWNLKVQVQALKSPIVSVQKLYCKEFAVENTEFEIIDSSFLLLTPIHVSGGIDLCIVAWILWPDEERSSSPNLEKEVKKRLSGEAAAAANQNGRWKNQMRRAAHNGCCRRVAQTRALCSVLWKLLVSEELTEALLSVEIPLVDILADMELWGIGVDVEGCLKARNVLGKKLRSLKKEAYKLAGTTFSLYTAADIAHVLYGQLKLPIPEKHNKGKQHPSTDKHCLDLLRHEHPIIPVIKEHRTLAKLLNCTLGSICSLARLSAKTHKHTLHGHWLQTSTATGRLSIEEPNLQCVEHMVVVKINKDKNGGEADADCYEINARDYFIPTQDNWLLLTADYSQIELRLMAHFSKDCSLIELLSKPHGDVFTLIAARWTGCPEESVGSHERDQTKRLVYGILYGMGSNTLSERLGCSPVDAKEKIQSFKSSFPGVASWLHEVVACCREKGYVKTLKGRKRFLSKIEVGSTKEKSKAERQAVNSVCQGSAADIIKIAMINIYSVIAGVDLPGFTSSLTKRFNMLNGCCRILLQVHDELVLEVDPSVLNEAASLLRMCMENAASLLDEIAELVMESCSRRVRLTNLCSTGALFRLSLQTSQDWLGCDGNCQTNRATFSEVRGIPDKAPSLGCHIASSSFIVDQNKHW
ncbi:DNA polymerase theta [Morus notabilis]|uniref:DNA polymerase theta n=1 Tax=Morus notabilis TaxID=981085 RepID=W9SY83_9ROSA|nr:DNA polymerase theta [Morus notabilis]